MELTRRGQDLKTEPQAEGASKLPAPTGLWLERSAQEVIRLWSSCQMTRVSFCSSRRLDALSGGSQQEKGLVRWDSSFLWIFWPNINTINFHQSCTLTLLILVQQPEFCSLWVSFCFIHLCHILDPTYKSYCVVLVFLFLTYFAQYDNLQVHPCCCKRHYFILFFLIADLYCALCCTGGLTINQYTLSIQLVDPGDASRSVLISAALCLHEAGNLGSPLSALTKF